VHAVTVADGALRWREHPDPVPGDDELLVDVRAAGVNAADLLQRQGLYPAPPGLPAWCSPRGSSAVASAPATA